MVTAIVVVAAIVRVDTQTAEPNLRSIPLSSGISRHMSQPVRRPPGRRSTRWPQLLG